MSHLVFLFVKTLLIYGQSIPPRNLAPSRARINSWHSPARQDVKITYFSPPCFNEVFKILILWNVSAFLTAIKIKMVLSICIKVSMFC